MLSEGISELLLDHFCKRGMVLNHLCENKFKMYANENLPGLTWKEAEGSLEMVY